RGSYKILGSGSVDFVQNHPYNGDEVIVYAAPEGDEVATYTRGTARLVEGEAIVSLGETFKWVTNPDIGLTAHLTPRSRGTVLFVESLTTEAMTVRSLEGFADDVVFDYLVYGLRIGFEEATVVQKKELEAHIPSMEDHRAAYAAHPYLRQYNALERYTAMRGALEVQSPLDFSASHALKNAVQEYDPIGHPSIMDAPRAPDSDREPPPHIDGERPARDVMEAEEMSGPPTRLYRAESRERDES
ncbi:hypothetical protein JXA88_07615, partial [Candidatus Fermentibacteria bacterium]|nr:hypothetical protein [Candidatus Fermentibacteria bacterium]